MSSLKRKKRKQVFTSPNKVQLIVAGKDYFDCLISMINNAKESIHLQTYIYTNDETGQMVANALKAAARRKVEVYVLVDGYASGSLTKAFIHDLTESGVHFRFFNPLLKSINFYFGRRLHHKIFVVDAKLALVGGINIANRYNDIQGIPAWLDFALHAEGEIALSLCNLCWKTWNNYPLEKLAAPCTRKNIQWNFPKEQVSRISMRRNDWVKAKNEISATYVNMFRHAESDIVILCSYFLPGRVIRRQLKFAAKRGIKIKVITAGISDVALAKYAERFMYSWLLRNNVELYEYQANVLHGKIAVCDESWATIGSYNINDISAYASIELNLNVDNPQFASETREMLLQIAKTHCIQITSDQLVKTNNIFNRFARWFSYQFIRVAFYLFTFYFKRMR